MTTKSGEGVCRRCGGPNVSWAAASPLWNEVMRGGDIEGPWEFQEIICPTCFVVLAKERGVADHFQLDAPAPLKPLTTVTPSGRGWDTARFLWSDTVEWTPVVAELAELHDKMMRMRP